MNNVTIYLEAKKLVDRLENHPDSTKKQIEKALQKFVEINEILDVQERRKHN